LQIHVIEQPKMSRLRNLAAITTSFLEVYRNLHAQYPRQDLALACGVAAAAAFAGLAVTTANAEPQSPVQPPPPLQASADITHMPVASSNESTAQWRVFTDVARDLVRQGREPEAEAYLKQALEAARRGFGPRDPHVASACQNLAELYRLLKRYEDAGPLYDAALAILADSYGTSDIRLAFALHNAAGFYFVQGHLDRAAELFEQSLQVKIAAVGPGHGETANTMFHLAETRWAQKRRDEAIDLAMRGLDVLEQQAMSDAACSRRRTRLAEMLMQQHRPALAEPLLRKVLDGVDALDYAARATAAENLAAALRDQNKLEESREFFQQALHARRQCRDSPAGQSLALSGSLRRLADVSSMIAGRESAESSSRSASLQEAQLAIEEACDVAEVALKEALALHSSEADSTLVRNGNDGSEGIQEEKTEIAGSGWFASMLASLSAMLPGRQNTEESHVALLALRKQRLRPESATLELAACLRTQAALARAVDGSSVEACRLLQRAMVVLEEGWPGKENTTSVSNAQEGSRAARDVESRASKFAAMRRDLICQVAHDLMLAAVKGLEAHAVAQATLHQYGCGDKDITPAG
jgi:tetratricopeptide (TPR) repeat protein